MEEGGQGKGRGGTGRKEKGKLQMGCKIKNNPLNMSYSLKTTSTSNVTDFPNVTVYL